MRRSPTRITSPMPAAPPCRPPPPANSSPRSGAAAAGQVFAPVSACTAPAVVGNVGARERINYTLVGAVANQASRLEGLNKAYGTEILASGEVAGLTSDDFVWRHVDRVVPAGTTEALEVYEPLAERSEATAETHAAFLSIWDAGRVAYAEGKFADALACF